MAKKNFHSSPIGRKVDLWWEWVQEDVLPGGQKLGGYELDKDLLEGEVGPGRRVE